MQEGLTKTTMTKTRLVLTLLRTKEPQVFSSFQVSVQQLHIASFTFAPFCAAAAYPNFLLFAQGPPGCGKTLTAEVSYVVCCSLL